MNYVDLYLGFGAAGPYADYGAVFQIILKNIAFRQSNCSFFGRL